MTSSDPVTIVLLGEPVPWARTHGGRTVGQFTPKKQRNNAATLAAVAQGEMRGRPPFDEPVHLHLLAEFPIPTGWSKRKREAALRGELRPGRRPDLSNILKQAEDALNTVVFRDDCLVVDVAAAKRYGLQPKVVITVSPALARLATERAA